MTRGEHIAQNVRDYLATNGLKKSQLTGALVAEIADRTLDHLERLTKKKKRLVSENDWIREMESDPAMEGTDVRASLAEAKFWCKNNQRDCTRRFFTNWLLNPKNRKIISGGGREEKKPLNGVEHAPTGWLQVLNELYPDAVLARGGLFEIKAETDGEWAKLDKSVRLAISREAVRR